MSEKQNNKTETIPNKEVSDKVNAVLKGKVELTNEQLEIKTNILDALNNRNIREGLREAKFIIHDFAPDTTILKDEEIKVKVKELYFKATDTGHYDIARIIEGLYRFTGIAPFYG